MLDFLLPKKHGLRVFQQAVPNRHWFKGVLALSQIKAGIKLIDGSRESARHQALFIESWLHQLTSLRSFPVAYKVQGAEHLLSDEGTEAGVFYCSFHAPFTAIGLRSLFDSGFPPEWVVADSQNINPDGRWLPAGIQQGVRAFPPYASTLLRARTELRAGKRIAAMADLDVGAPLKPELMRLAGRLNAKVVLCWAEMHQRTIWVHYESPPYPVPDTERKVLANLEAVDLRRQQVITGAKAHR